MAEKSKLSLRLQLVVPNSVGLLHRILDPLYSNTAYLFLGQVMLSGLMYVYWIVASRLLPAKEVGLAAAVISAINLLAGIGNMGLGTAIIGLSSAYNGKTASDIVNVSIAIGLLVSLVIACIFLLGLPIWSPSLSILNQEPTLAITFVLFIVANTLVNLQTSAMLSRRRGEFLFLRFLTGGLLAIPLVLFFSIFFPGNWAILWSYNLPVLAIAATSSLFVLPRYFDGFRLIGSINFHVLRELIRYAPVNQLVDLVWSAPQFLLPLIVTNTLSHESAAYFYMPWMIANVLLSFVRANTASLFVESSRDLSKLNTLIKRTLILSTLIVFPLIVFLWFIGGKLLWLFGEAYINLQLLHILLIAVIPFLFNSITFVVFRVQRKNKYLILFTLLVIVVSTFLSYHFSFSMGLIGVGVGWLSGQSLSTMLMGLMYIVNMTRKKILV